METCRFTLCRFGRVQHNVTQRGHVINTFFDNEKCDKGGRGVGEGAKNGTPLAPLPVDNRNVKRKGQELLFYTSQ